MDIVRYSFFEAQKGKTSHDSHFAAFKFALKSLVKKGNDLLEIADIVDGTTDNLKGTHVYEIHINRFNEPQSAKTLDGIRSFSDFTFVKSPKETHKSVVAREFTDRGTTMTIIPNNKLFLVNWSYFRIRPKTIRECQTKIQYNNTQEEENIGLERNQQRDGAK
jgi:hypothetical protein